jgi:hypothetical protein
MLLTNLTDGEARRNVGEGINGEVAMPKDLVRLWEWEQAGSEVGAGAEVAEPREGEGTEDLGVCLFLTQNSIACASR